tara:strand:+ start:664 stop:1125 length:462 start_codon:yes stop_codon:yes gene_type:complete
MSNIHAFRNQIYWNENNEQREVKCNKCIPINSFYLLQDSDSDSEEITIKNNNEKIRTKAFYILQNKKLMSNNLKNTKLCKFGKNCQRSICHFAHSLEDLKPAQCIFGNACNFQKSKTKICGFIHPNETIDQFIERTGLELPQKNIFKPKEIYL